MDRAKIIWELSQRLIPHTMPEQIDNNKYYYQKTDEEEQPFSNLCAIIKKENVILTPADKELIDEIGESLWNDGEYWQFRMKTKYWKEMVE